MVHVFVNQLAKSLSNSEVVTARLASEPVAHGPGGYVKVARDHRRCLIENIGENE